MSVSIFTDKAYIVEYFIIFELIVIPQFIPTATTEIELFEICRLIEYLKVSLHYFFLVGAFMQHQVLSTTITMNGVKFIVILCELCWAIVAVALTVFMVWVIATTTLHTTVHVLLICLVDEFYFFSREAFREPVLETYCVS